MDEAVFPQNSKNTQRQRSSSSSLIPNCSSASCLGFAPAADVSSPRWECRVFIKQFGIWLAWLNTSKTHFELRVASAAGLGWACPNAGKGTGM